jgi:hypothetical protein
MALSEGVEPTAAGLVPFVQFKAVMLTGRPGTVELIVGT